MSDEYGESLVNGLKGCSREPYWSEMTAAQKIAKLGDVVFMLAREVKQQAEIIMDLTQHAHGQKGEIVVPIHKQVCEVPYWLKNPLGDER